MNKDQDRIKSLKFARSYKEATGYYYHSDPKPSKFPLVVVIGCIALLLMLL